MAINHMMDDMRITVNNEVREFDSEATVKQLLSLIGLNAKPCAVEVNRQVVPKARHEEHVLTDGDQVEIVTLVGGG